MRRKPEIDYETGLIKTDTVGKRRKRVIKETKCTCMACGNVWYYGKKELWDNKGERLRNSANKLDNLGSDMMCCSGCLPAIFIPRKQIKQVRDLSKCSECNSKAVHKEEVIHEV